MSSGYENACIEVGSNIDSYASVYSPITNIIYSFPYNVASTTLYMLDVATNITSAVANAIPSGRYISATYAPNNNKIYALNMTFSGTTTFIVVYDVLSRTFTTISINLNTIDFKYRPDISWINGAYASSNNCIYYVPQSDLNLIIINTIDNTVTYIPFYIGDDVSSFWGCIYSESTNQVHGIPCIIDPGVLYYYYFISVDTNTVNYNSNISIPTSGIISSVLGYNSGVLGANGKIYCFPYEQSIVLEINPRSGNNLPIFTFVNTLNTGIISSGAVSNLNNIIYCSSGSGYNKIYAINTNTLTFTNTISKPTTNEYYSTLFTNNGTMYATSSVSNSKLISLEYKLVFDQNYFINGINAVVLPGMIVPYVSIGSPIGWRICDGSAYDASNNPYLDAVLGNPVTKNLPNLNAYFLRGSGTASNVNYAAGSVRTFQTDAVKSHTHPITETPHTHTYRFNPITDAADTSSRSGAAGTVTFDTGTTVVDISINSIGDIETRPYCYGVNYIIKMDTDLLYDTSLLAYHPFDNTINASVALWNYNRYFINKTITNNITNYQIGTGGSNTVVINSAIGTPCLRIAYSQIGYSVNPPLFNRDNFTVTLWVRSEVYTNNQRFLSISPPGGGFAVLQHYNGRISWDTDGTYFKNYVISSTVVPQNTWAHISMVVNGTSLLYYVNNVLVSSQTRTAYGSSTTDPITYFVGSIDNTAAIDYLDELRIYNRSLSATEITEIYEYGGVLQ